MTASKTLGNYPAFIVGLHGQLELHPLVARQWELGEFGDVYGLLVQRSVSLGLAEFGSRADAGVRWHQHEAGGDWTQDGEVREAAWMQAGLLDECARVPAWQAMTCLGDVLSRVGRFDLRGVHAVLPLGADILDNEHFTTSHQWFILVEQGRPEEVGISVRTPAKDEIDPAGLVAEVEARSLSTIAVEVLNAPASGMPDPDTFDGRWPLGGDVVEVHLSCRVPEWSLDMAGFTTDLVSDATRACGVRTPAAISIFRTG
ncbi:hypothetical protein [Saccharopolyspora sp. NPDC049357]|uniref:hypothetical protein n=1 Tax=Saccharopolyspora sp. NPDC049357 TaxID=3154507 RepID=UPI00341DF030